MASFHPRSFARDYNNIIRPTTDRYTAHPSLEDRPEIHSSAGYTITLIGFALGRGLVLREFLQQFALLELPEAGALLIDQIALPLRLHVLDEAFVHGAVVVADGHLAGLVNLALHEPSDVLRVAYLQYPAPFRTVVDPLAVVVELSLVLAAAVPHALLELPHVDVLTGDELPLSFVEVVPEVAYVLVQGVREFPVALSASAFELALVELVFIQVVPVPDEPMPIHLTHVDISGLPRFVREADLLTFKVTRPAPPETQFVVVPVVVGELLVGQQQTVVVVFNEETGRTALFHNVGDLVVVELEEVGKGVGLQQSREGDGCNFVGNERGEILTASARLLLSLLVEHDLVVGLLLLAFVLGVGAVLALVVLAVGSPLGQTAVGLHDAHQLQLQEVVELVADAVLAALVPQRLLSVDHLLDLRDEGLLPLRQRLPWSPRFLLLDRAVLEVDQHLDPVVVGLLQQTVGSPDEETAPCGLLELGQQVEVLDVEGHRHEVVGTEGAEGQRVLPQGLHVPADGFGEDAEGTQSGEEREQRQYEGTGGGTRMREDDHPLLVENSLPDLVELLDAEQVDDHLQVAADVQLAHLQLRPALPQPLVEFAVGRLYEVVVVVVGEESLGGAGQPQLQVAEQREGTDHGQGLLHVGAGDLAVLVLHLLGDLDLLEVADAEEHAGASVEGGFEVEEVVVLHLVVRGVRHGVVHHQVLDLLHRLRLRVAVLHLRAALVVEVDHGHAHHRLLHLHVALVVLVHGLLQQQCLAFQFALGGWDEDVVGVARQTVGGGDAVGLQTHLVLLQQVVGDVVVGVVLEVGLELVVGLQVDLARLQHPQRLPQSARDLVAHEVQVVRHQVQFLQFLRQKFLPFQNELHYYRPTPGIHDPSFPFDTFPSPARTKTMLVGVYQRRGAIQFGQGQEILPKLQYQYRAVITQRVQDQQRSLEMVGSQKLRVRLLSISLPLFFRDSYDFGLISRNISDSLSCSSFSFLFSFSSFPSSSAYFY